MHKILIMLVVAVFCFAEVNEKIETTCPPDPTYGGKCVLKTQTQDAASCRTINGQEYCRDWWSKTYNYECNGRVGLDNVLTGIVGQKYCTYNKQCTQWEDVAKSGGNPSCRIYYNKYKSSACEANPIQPQCISNDCGELFDKCSLSQYVPYDDIADPANTEYTYSCDSGGYCSYVASSGGVSGVKLGIYTFQCPSSVTKVCRSWSGEYKCPDGSSQVCNTVKTCKSNNSSTSTITEPKECVASRGYTKYTTSRITYKDAQCINVAVWCTTHGWCSTAQNAIQNGHYETFINGSYWQKITSITGCSTSCDYATINGAGFGRATNLSFCKYRSCSNVDVRYSSEGIPFYYCKAQSNSEGISCPLDKAYTKSTVGSDTICTETLSTQLRNNPKCVKSAEYVRDNNISNGTVVVEEEWHCYNDTIDVSLCQGITTDCKKLTNTTNLDEIDCRRKDADIDNPINAICSQFNILYECPAKKTDSVCAEWEEKLVCTNGMFAIPDVGVVSKDFSASFGMAAAKSQAVNEMKNIWSGTQQQCQSGMFSGVLENFGDYMVNKAIGFAMQYLGSKVASYASAYFTAARQCFEQPLVVMMHGSSVTYTGDMAMSIDQSAMSYAKNDYTACMSSAANDQLASGDSGMKNFISKSLGADVTNNPVVSHMIENATIYMAAFQVVYDIASSIKNCSTCSDEKCANSQNEYKQFSLISNRLCHFVDSKCTKKLDLGFYKTCLRTGYKHCCYNSKFTRILVEQAYSQLGYNWGSYDSPNCTQLSFDDLNRLDFSKMDFSEFVGEIQAKMQTTYFDPNIANNRIQNFYDNTQNPIKPTKETPWGN